MARLSLSSVALRDGIVHGLPVTGRELGMSILELSQLILYVQYMYFKVVIICVS